MKKDDLGRAPHLWKPPCNQQNLPGWRFPTGMMIQSDEKSFRRLVYNRLRGDKHGIWLRNTEK